MSHALPLNWFQERRMLSPDVCRTTVIYLPAGGSRLLIYSPFWEVKLVESLLKVWRELRDSAVPQKEAMYILLTLHPWCWEKWGGVAQKIIQPHDRQGDWFDDVIQEAQMVLKQEIDHDDKLWELARATRDEDFPGWIIEVMKNRCRNAWNGCDRHLSGTKKKRREPIAEEAIEEIVDNTDLVGAAAAKEFWEKVDASCTEPVRKMLRLRGLGFTIREIAASLQYSKTHVARAIKTEFDRLRIDLKSFL